MIKFNKEYYDDNINKDVRLNKFLQLLNKYFKNKNISRSTLESFKIAMIYSIFGYIWILLSDKSLGFLIKDREILIHIQMYKGWIYVIATAIVIYLLIKKSISMTELVIENLAKSYEELNYAHEELVAIEEELREKYEEIQKSKEDLRLSEERYKLAIEGANDSIWDWDIKNNGLFTFSQTKKILGFNDIEIENNIDSLINLIHPDDLDHFQKLLNDHLNMKTPYYKTEYRARTKNNEYRWIMSKGKAIFDVKGNAIRMAGSHRDITESKLFEEKIKSLAYFDSLTGLYNRNIFEDKLQLELKKAENNNSRLALLYLDLDNFKKINDTLGHDYGDKFIKDIAVLLKKCVNSNNIIARLAGDEFAILLPEINDKNDIVKFINNIMRYFIDPWSFEFYEFYISPSIGISIYPDDGVDAKILLKNADIAMYDAKQGGKSCYSFYTSKMNEKIMKNIEMEFNLRRAISRNELVLYYQPQVDLKNGAIVGVEALIRWIRPNNIIVPPMEFIPLAEESGLIIEIGEWIIKTACQQYKIWLDKGYKNFLISINLSAKQFKQKNLVESIQTILNETGMDGNYLEIELTETTAMNDIDFTTSVLYKLKEMGIRVSLDDFGTGYSSLNYLKQLPIDTLKMDKSFISDINGNSYEKQIVKSVINLAHNMNLTVTAEGVEKVEQLEFLKNEKCDKVQGYIFSKPIPADEIEKIINEHNLYIY